ncbi:MAG TPA: AI-2E family transporter [Ktedonobacteraceae bacterium]
MTLQTSPVNTSKDDANNPYAVLAKWARRCGLPLAILGWSAVIALIFWGAAHVIRSILLLIVAALLAFALAPLVKILQRFMPRFLAILIVYLFTLGVIGLLLYFITVTAIIQGRALVQQMQGLLGTSNDPLLALMQPLRRFGVTTAQITSIRQQIVGHLGGFANEAVPFLRGFLDFLLDIVIVAVVSIYLLIDGSRVTNWLRHNMPMTQRGRANFILDTLQRIVGGYIRGQLFLSTLVGLLVGIGMRAFGVPYAVLLGVLAFVLEFVPVLGTLISGAICILVALTQGWLIALGVLIYFTIVHVLEGDIIGPRIVGKAVGLHPVVSLTALVAGAELFGIWGALFASPVAGVVQALLVSIWAEWREHHPEQFPEKDPVQEQLDKKSAG